MDFGLKIARRNVSFLIKENIENNKGLVRRFF
jgi:hypothetical protein